MFTLFDFLPLTVPHTLLLLITYLQEYVLNMSHSQKKDVCLLEQVDLISMS